VRPQLERVVENVFGYKAEAARKLIAEILMCVRRRHLITIYRLGEDNQQDIDHAILTALLKGQKLSAPDQLDLALAWNRVDIARTEIFVLGQEWPPGALHA
jgi:transient receptor potential cation channel subfamily M protein 3